jgi:hypothetical protein
VTAAHAQDVRWAGAAGGTVLGAEMVKTLDAVADVAGESSQPTPRVTWGRARKNHWVAVAVLTLAGLSSVPILFAFADSFYPNDTVSVWVFYGGVVVVSAALLPAIRGLTRSRWWWLPAVLLSPAVVLAAYIAAVNLRLIPVPY